MRTLTTTEYSEVCKSYAQFGSKLFDEMFLGYGDSYDTSVSYLYPQDYYFTKEVWKMKYILCGVIAFLLYNSPDARNATGDILRKGADFLQTEQQEQTWYEKTTTRFSRN